MRYSLDMQNVFHNIATLSEAARFLSDENICFEKCVQQRYSNDTPGIFIYFMLDSKDVAYYWPSMQILVTNDTPRSWASFISVETSEVLFGTETKSIDIVKSIH